MTMLRRLKEGVQVPRNLRGPPLPFASPRPKQDAASGSSAEQPASGGAQLSTGAARVAHPYDMRRCAARQEPGPCSAQALRCWPRVAVVMIDACWCCTVSVTPRTPITMHVCMVCTLTSPNTVRRCFSRNSKPPPPPKHEQTGIYRYRHRIFNSARLLAVQPESICMIRLSHAELKACLHFPHALVDGAASIDCATAIMRRMLLRVCQVSIEFQGGWRVVKVDLSSWS